MSYFKIVKVLFSFLAPCPPLNLQGGGTGWGFLAGLRSAVFATEQLLAVGE
jgi:hypothetical protein